MQTEASRAGYIGVWVLAGVLSGLSSGVLSSIMISEFIRTDGSGSITALVVLPATVGAVAWCLTYMFFPSINTNKVVPYHLVGGLVAAVGYVIFSTSQAASYRNVSSDVAEITIPMTILLWIAVLIFLTKRGEWFEANSGSSIPEASPEPTTANEYDHDSYKPAPTAFTPPDRQPAQKPPSQASVAAGKGDSASIETQPDPYAKARKVIEYSDDAELSWGVIQGLPENYKNQFLEALSDDPKTDTTALAERLTTESDKEQRPFEDPELNDILDRCRKISDEAASEFMEVYELLGDTIKPEELLAKIKAKFLSPEWIKQKKTDEWKAQQKAKREADQEARAKAYHQHEAEREARATPRQK